VIRIYLAKQSLLDASGERASCLTITTHSHRKALLQAAVLAAIAMVLGHFTVHRPSALVAQLFAYRSLEETFAALAANCAIVTAGRAISTDEAVLDVVVRSHLQLYVCHVVRRLIHL